LSGDGGGRDKDEAQAQGPKGDLDAAGAHPQKLEVISVGDPVVAKCYESVAFEVKKAGSATRAALSRLSPAQPGETPPARSGARSPSRRRSRHRQEGPDGTIKGEGNTETVKARMKNLDKVKVGDLVESRIRKPWPSALMPATKAAKPAKGDAPAK
jgi:hypothetical protein